MISALRALKDKLFTRIKRDGAREAVRYYVLVLFRHGIHYCIYDFWHDRREAHRSAGAASISAGDVVGSTEGLEGRGYQAFPRLLLLWSLKALDIAPARFSFIDYGSGRGRLLLTAARLPFRRVIGVEFSRSLHEQAVENITRYPRGVLVCKEINSLNIDAADYDPPAGNLVTFFYNPFNEQVLNKVADGLAAAGQRGRTVYVIFATSKRMKLFPGRTDFQPIALRPWDRIRLKVLGTVPIEFFRLDDQDDRTRPARAAPDTFRVLQACFIATNLLLGFAPESAAFARPVSSISIAAVDDSRPALEPDGESPFVQGVHFAELGKLDEAIAAFRKEIEIHPQNELAYFGLGGIHYRQKEYQAALADFTKAIELKPSLDALYNRGLVRLRMDQNDEAIADFDQAVLRNPAFPHTYCNRGLAYARKKMSDRALLDYFVGIRLGTPHLNINYCFFNRGDLLLREQRYDEAINDFSAGLQMTPSSPFALLKRGRAYELKGSREQADKDYEEAAKLDPSLRSPEERQKRLDRPL